jgi:hypothetical protein
MKYPTKKFTISCEMSERWIPQFLGMLKMMQTLGGLGGSRIVKFYSDGDGDYQPKFEWDKDLPKPAQAIDKSNDEYLYDAG